MTHTIPFTHLGYQGTVTVDYRPVESIVECGMDHLAEGQPFDASVCLGSPMVHSAQNPSIPLL